MSPPYSFERCSSPATCPSSALQGPPSFSASDSSSSTTPSASITPSPPSFHDDNDCAAAAAAATATADATAIPHSDPSAPSCVSVCDGFVDCEAATVCSDHCDDEECAQNVSVCFDENCFEYTHDTNFQYLLNNSDFDWSGTGTGTDSFLPKTTTTHQHQPLIAIEEPLPQPLPQSQPDFQQQQLQHQQLHQHQQQLQQHQHQYQQQPLPPPPPPPPTCTSPRHFFCPNGFDICDAFRNRDISSGDQHLPQYPTNANAYDLPPASTTTTFNDYNNNFCSPQCNFHSDTCKCLFPDSVPACDNCPEAQCNEQCFNSPARPDIILPQLDTCPAISYDHQLDTPCSASICCEQIPCSLAPPPAQLPPTTISSTAATPFLTVPIPTTEAPSDDLLSCASFDNRQIYVDEQHICKCTLDDGTVCSAVFQTSEQLQDHLIASHVKTILGKQGLGFYCTWQDCHRPHEPFSQKSKLQGHFLTHSNHKGFKCKTCGKAFARQATLERHERSHQGLKPYRCETCGKCFTDSSELKTHTRTHTGEKPFKCNHPGCNFETGDSSNMSSHKLTHGVRRHKCTFPRCTKSFTRPDQLKRHMRTTHKAEYRDSMSISPIQRRLPSAEMTPSVFAFGMTP